MHFTTVVASFFALPVLVNAQYGYAPPAGSSSAASATSASSAAVPSAPPSSQGFINVDVAPGGNFTFSPANSTAPNGTIVTFFFPNAGLSHTVTQSSFADPCTPLPANSTTGASAGFDSSFQAGVQFSINITNDQIPIWFHCKMPQHCGLGMVGSINAPTNGTNTFDAFMANALAIGTSEPVESTGPVVLGGFAATAIASPAATVSASGSSSPSSGSSSSGSGSASDATRLTATSAAVALLGAAVTMIFFA